MKRSFIASNFPIIVILALFIYPFIMVIVICVKNKEFKNSGLAICAEIFSILGIFCIVTFIMEFLLKYKSSTKSVE